jgi:hypothetical protein
MEHRRRTVSNVIDDDIEKQISRSCGKSASLDEARDNHIEYIYNGHFSVYNFIFCGVLKLICPCFVKKRDPVIIDI